MIFIGLGSNLGDRTAFLAEARARMNQAGIRVVRESSVIETDPVGYADQGRYLNQVVEVDTQLTPRELLNALLAIETAMGRVRTIRNGPRNIDLDVLIYNQVSLNEPGLELPHPRMMERSFVLEPLRELGYFST